MLALSLTLLVIAYLCGSISSAVLICRACGLPDPRKVGSGNAGATNVWRMGRPGAALGVVAFDMAKGALPVWAAWMLGVTPLWIGFIGLAACLGHSFPLFFRFRGGKGVATAFGAMAPLGWGVMLALIVSWLLMARVTRYASLASILCAVIAPFLVWWIAPSFTFPVALLACLIILRHHENIHRLWRGTEHKLSDF